MQILHSKQSNKSFKRYLYLRKVHLHLNPSELDLFIRVLLDLRLKTSGGEGGPGGWHGRG